MDAQQPIAQKISLGPIIGKVTNDSARILIEYVQNGLETLSLVDSNGKRFDCQRRVTANRPVIFEFKGLSPVTIYQVTSAYQFPAGKSSFRTLDSKAAPTNFALNSCNSRHSYEKYNDQNNLWGDIAKRAVNKEIDYIIHLGDQIYMDYYNEAYNDCIDLINKTDQSAWGSIIEQVREMIRVEYRLTFGGKLEAIALANCPNLMQFDDHDARDDLGFRACDVDVTTPDGFYVQQCRWCYYEYQRSLREDIDFSNIDNIKFEFHSHILNNIGIFFVDYRGKTSWLRAPEPGQLGEMQWAALRKTFKPVGGDFDNCELVILISTLPFVLYSKGWTGVCKKLVHDTQEEWEYKHQQEHVDFMNLMDDWKIAKKGQRDIFVVGGDIHHGGHTSIKRDGRQAYGQIVTSGICQVIPNKGLALLEKIACRTAHTLKNGWSWKHHDWTLRNNYATISVKSLFPPTYSVQMITSEPEGKIKEEKIVTYGEKIVTYGEKKKRACCKIF